MSGGGAGSSGGGILAAALAATATLLLALLVAGLLAPDVSLDPIAVEASDFLPAEAVERAVDFRAGQRNLILTGLAIELLALALLAAGRPRRLSKLGSRFASRPVLGAGLLGVAIAVLLALLALPTGWIAHQRAVEVGLSVQSTSDWLTDRASTAAISALTVGVGAMILISLQRRFPRLWWLAASAVVVVYAVLTTWIGPVVLAPVFNDFERLEPGPVRSQALDLAARAGVDVGEVYRVDASRRSTALNAYVDGIGSSKRIVLYDNLLASADRPVMRSLLAHELAHIAAHDLRRGLLFVALIAPPGMLTVFLLGNAIASSRGIAPGTPLAVPAFALPLVVVAFVLGLVGNQLSREVERAADAKALELTDDPRGMIELQRKLALRNRSDPGPLGPLDRILRTHPATVERIGAALAFERQRTESGMNSGDAR